MSEIPARPSFPRDAFTNSSPYISRVKIGKPQPLLELLESLRAFSMRKR